MRVTNEVKQYIAKRIRGLYQRQFDELDAKIKEENAKIEAIRHEVLDIFVEKLKAIGYVDAEVGASVTYNTWRSYRSGNNPYDAINEEKNKLTDKINSQTDEVIVSLSLGGTKEDLDRILNGFAEEAQADQG